MYNKELRRSINPPKWLPVPILFRETENARLQHTIISQSSDAQHQEHSVSETTLTILQLADWSREYFRNRTWQQMIEMARLLRQANFCGMFLT